MERIHRNQGLAECIFKRPASLDHNIANDDLYVSELISDSESAGSDAASGGFASGSSTGCDGKMPSTSSRLMLE